MIQTTHHNIVVFASVC